MSRRSTALVFCMLIPALVLASCATSRGSTYQDSVKSEESAAAKSAAAAKEKEKEEGKKPTVPAQPVKPNIPFQPPKPSTPAWPSTPAPSWNPPPPTWRITIVPDDEREDGDDDIGKDIEDKEAWDLGTDWLEGRMNGLGTGVSGAAFAPDASALGGDRSEFDVNFIAHLEPTGNTLAGRAVQRIGWRFGIGLPESANGKAENLLEFAFSSMFVYHPGSTAAISPDFGDGMASFKYAYREGDHGIAAYLRGGFAQFVDQNAGTWFPSWDGPTRYPGIAFGLVGETSTGPFRVFGGPELEVSNFYPSWASGSWTVPGMFVWGYLRLGADAELGPFTIGLSGALRSVPFGTGFAVGFPIAFGGEVRWRPEGLPLSVSFLASGEARGGTEFYLSAGLSAGLRMPF